MLICIAMLVGSDYTEGIESVGIVKAIEILQQFDGDTGFEKLNNFKKWYDNREEEGDETSKKNKIPNYLKKLEIKNNFPSDLVYKAYWEPDVDKQDLTGIVWNTLPDLNELRRFLMSKLKWPEQKINDDLVPLIKRINETKVQQSIGNFFTFDSENKLEKGQTSKRMMSAIKSFKAKKINSSLKKTVDCDINLSEDDDDITIINNHKTKDITLEEALEVLNSSSQSESEKNVKIVKKKCPTKRKISTKPSKNNKIKKK
jgi:5'-3' exonuclease